MRPDRWMGGKVGAAVSQQSHFETTFMPRSSHVPRLGLTLWPIVTDLQHFADRSRGRDSAVSSLKKAIYNR
jgi:hypothetical protein